MIAREEEVKKETMARVVKGRKTPEDQSFWEHLEELRWTLLKIVACLALVSLTAFIFADRLLEAVRWPLTRMGAGVEWETEFVLRSLSPAEAFSASLQLSLLAGLILSLPFILYFSARFVFPALTPEEKRGLGPAFVAGGVLFYVGAAFAFIVVLPLSLRFFWLYTQRLGVRPEWSLRNYTALVNKTSLAFGLAFEVPLVLLLLAKLEIVDYPMLKKFRRQAVVAIFVLAAVLTPPDVVSQVLLAVPILVLFELTLWMVKLATKHKHQPS